GGEAQGPAAGVGEGPAVDPACPTTAETKFDQSIAKAEARGRFAVSGDGATIEAAVDSCVDSIVTLTSRTSTTTTTLPSNPGCCSFGPQSANVPFSGCTMDLALCPNRAGRHRASRLVGRHDGTCGPVRPPMSVSERVD